MNKNNNKLEEKKDNNAQTTIKPKENKEIIYVFIRKEGKNYGKYFC